MKCFLISAATLIALTATVQAEITCTERGGCWETGGHVRLPDSPYRGVTTSILSRTNPNARIDTRQMPYLDTPGQGAARRGVRTNNRSR